MRLFLCQLHLFGLCGFIGEVDVRTFPIDEGDQFMILASDGLWDVMSSEEAVSIVHNVMSDHVGALREGGGTSDGSSDRPGMSFAKRVIRSEKLRTSNYFVTDLILFCYF